MVTGFGKFCRKLKLTIQKYFQMARRLGVSSAFLSKVENGLKSRPKIGRKK